VRQLPVHSIPAARIGVGVSDGNRMDESTIYGECNQTANPLNLVS
jgi:hypothetical protein